MDVLATLTAQNKNKCYCLSEIYFHMLNTLWFYYAIKVTLSHVNSDYDILKAENGVFV